MRGLRSVRARHVALAATVLFGVLACAISRPDDLPVQSWWQARGPVVPHAGFPADCGLCHEGEGWRTIREDFQFDHAAETGTALEGAHARAECLRCHNDRGPVSLYAQRGCAGCHEDPHRGQLGKGCVDCHEQEDWRPRAQIAQHDRWGFPLVGRHAGAACWRCHPNAQVGNFTRTPTTCAECHQDDLARATVPDHVSQGWVSRCDECHIPTTWTGAGFNHGWPLTGAHKSADCGDCHAGGMYAGTPTQCVACHLSDYQGATSPDHVAAGFSTSCENCHNTSAWKPANLNHSFPINSGPHATLDCSDCHLNPSNFLSFSCTHCHEHNEIDMGDKHSDVPGYVWSSPACYQCHPDGQE